MTKTITSLQNPLVKSILDLQQKSSARKSTGQFVAEGRREVSLAIANGYKVEQIVFCPEIYKHDPSYPVDLNIISKEILVEVSKNVYNKLAYREDAEGIILVAHSKTRTLDEVNISEQPFFIVLEGLEKPGNLGAVLRTSDAVGAAAVLMCDSKTDVYNPNTIRAAMGCTFTVPIVNCTSQQAIDWLKKNKVTIYAAALETQISYTDADFTKPAAVAFGTEKFGLTKNWTDNADTIVKIPMKGLIDSLNVSVSVAIMAYEALRQRMNLK
jgi:TrmH family RNA methyltransferase